MERVKLKKAVTAIEKVKKSFEPVKKAADFLNLLLFCALRQRSLQGNRQDFSKKSSCAALNKVLKSHTLRHNELKNAVNSVLRARILHLTVENLLKRTEFVQMGL